MPFSCLFLFFSQTSNVGPKLVCNTSPALKAGMFGAQAISRACALMIFQGFRLFSAYTKTTICSVALKCPLWAPPKDLCVDSAHKSTLEFSESNSLSQLLHARWKGSSDSVLSPCPLGSYTHLGQLSRPPRKIRCDGGMQQDMPRFRSPWDLSPPWLS